MHLPRFTYMTPGSIKEAVNLFNEYPDSALMAGGTDLLPRMKYRLDLADRVISLKGLRAETPTVTSEGSLVLDAMMTLNSINHSSLIRERAPILADAAQMVASNEIRNMGTLGGNLCQETRCLYYNQSHRFQFVEACYKRGGDLCYFIPRGKKCWAVFMADTAPALISLGAEIKIMGPEGVRQMPLEDFYTGDAKQPFAMAPGEILFEVIVPNGAVNRAEAFVKLSLRGGLEFAALSMAAVMDLKEDRKTCYQARLTVGAVSSRPKRALKGEAALTERPLSQDRFSEVANLLVQEIDPVPHHGHSRAYLAEALKVVVRGVLAKAAERINEDG